MILKDNPLKLPATTESRKGGPLVSHSGKGKSHLQAITNNLEKSMGECECLEHGEQGCGMDMRAWHGSLRSNRHAKQASRVTATFLVVDYVVSFFTFFFS